MHSTRHLPLDRCRALLAGSMFMLAVLVAPLAASAQSTGYERVVDMTFPVPADTYTVLYDSYFDARGGGSRVHRANDIMADKMVPIAATVDGEICTATGVDEAMPSYGYLIRLCGDDGLVYVYVHINNDTPGTDDGAGGVEHAYAPGIEKGVRVTRGQHIAFVGDSGNAEGTGPHIHFEIHDEEMTEQEGQVNPFYSLEAAEERGDFPEAPVPLAEGGSPTVTGEGEPTAFTRLAGDNRLQTAVALSGQTRDSARAVIIVPADSHVEALVAAPLAALIDAPILLSGPDGLGQDVMEEVRRLSPPNAYIIGTTDQLSEDVATDLEDAGVRNLARINARDRYALSAAVAEEIMSYPQVEGVDQVILALGDAPDATRAWPDALSASALAAGTLTPILLTEGDRLPDAVADLLTRQRPDRIIVVGGTAAITEEVAVEAAELADGTLTRLAGDTRFATSIAVAEAGREAGLRAEQIWVATGRNFPDALAAGPAAALSGSPLVLVDGLEPGGSPESRAWLAEHAASLVVVGGEAVITDEVAAGLAS